MHLHGETRLDVADGLAITAADLGFELDGEAHTWTLGGTLDALVFDAPCSLAASLATGPTGGCSPSPLAARRTRSTSVGPGRSASVR